MLDFDFKGVYINILKIHNKDAAIKVTHKQPFFVVHNKTPKDMNAPSGDLFPCAQE